MKKPTDAVTAFRSSVAAAQAIIARDATDSSAWTLVLRTRSGLCPALASIGRREEALQCGRQSIADAVQLDAHGPDRVSMSLYIPRTQMWMGDVYLALGDRKEAAEYYSKALQAWQKMHDRPDFARLQAEIAECAKKAGESNHRANPHV